MRRACRQALAAKHEVAIVGTFTAGEQVEQGGLASAVGADQPEDLTLFDFERDVVQRLQAAVALADLARVQQAHASRLRGGRRQVARGRHAPGLPVVVVRMAVGKNGSGIEVASVQGRGACGCTGLAAAFSCGWP